jgi:uncharacterized protein YndB with AHSA1/START domain
MSTNSVEIDAPAASAFEVLADGWSFSNWVVGASHMRAVEANWPEPGSKLFHAVGSWPMLRRDETEVEDMVPGQRLQLIARGRPLGEARVTIELAPLGVDRCQVTMHETPISGPGSWVPESVIDPLLRRRNTESLARLAALVERRTSP